MPAPLVPPEQNHPLAEAWAIVQSIAQNAKKTGSLTKVKTLKTCSGDLSDYYPPTLAELPWMRLAPVSCPMRIGSESEWEADLMFSYEIGVAGTNVIDLLNLCGMLVTAFSQSTETPLGNVQALYRGQGIRVIEFKVAAIGPSFPRTVGQTGTEPPPPPFMKAQGLVHGQVYFSN